MWPISAILVEKWPKWWKIGQNGGKMAEMAGTAKKWPKNGQNCYNGQKMAKMVEKWPKWLKMAKIVGK